MTIAVQPLEHVTQRVLLPHVCWETYERLLADHQDSSGLYFTYDQGGWRSSCPPYGMKN